VARRLSSRSIKPARWPSYDESERVRRLARQRVADISGDVRLLELLARACSRAAGEEYERLMAR
jgi:hypothetical protein